MFPSSGPGLSFIICYEKKKKNFLQNKIILYFLKKHHMRYYDNSGIFQQYLRFINHVNHCKVKT